MEEIWKDIVGYEGLYQVSNYGNVRGVARRVRTWNAYKTQRKLGNQINNKGTSLPVLCVELNTVFPSIRAAVRSGAGKDESTITKCCKGKKHTHNNKHWRYYNE